MFSRPDSNELAVLVYCEVSLDNSALDEFELLVESTGASIVGLVTGQISNINPKFFIGSGKLDEISHVILETGAKLVIFSHQLTPAQERNIEKYLKCRVIDKNRLILDIFAQRAKTFEGKLQVELAQLQYMTTRLVRGWTHLERQKGGIGLRGPGETQLEVDRRLIRDRIRTIKKKLEKVRKQRDVARKSRAKSDLPILSLVGYTNSGKSSLFNALVNESTLAEDKLFATLDPTLRRLEITDVGPVILGDTVGFIRDLPHALIEAFRSTLDETRQADLLLHVIDASDCEKENKIKIVNNVLKEINADTIPHILVYNKIDLLDGVTAGIERNELGIPISVRVSAFDNNSLLLLKNAIGEVLTGGVIEVSLNLPVSKSDKRAKLYKSHAVLNESYSEEGEYILDIRSSLKELDKIFDEKDSDWQQYIKNI